MTTPIEAAKAAEHDPMSDEYVNAVIQQHGYDSPETVIARLAQWIGLHGGENSITLLMYEAHKALSKLRAPVAELRIGVSATGQSATVCIMQPHSDGSFTAIYSETHPIGDSVGRAALASAPVACNCPGGNKPADLHAPNCPVRVSSARLLDPYDGGTWVASAPVAGEAQPVAWLHQCRKKPELTQITMKKHEPALAAKGFRPVPLYAAPQASAPDLVDAYEGAREDLAIWKRRALEAERDLRAERETSARLAAAVNGPSFMGEPAPQASAEDVRNAALEDAASGINVEAAAMTLAEHMHYPWAHMPEQGRAQMRIFAQSVVSAALSATQPEQGERDE